MYALETPSSSAGLPDAALRKRKGDPRLRRNAVARSEESARRDHRSTETAKPTPSDAGDKAAKADAPFGSQGVRRAAATAAGETIPAPGPNERVEAAIEPGQTLRLEFPRLHNVRFAVQDDGLLIVLPDGGEILLANFVAAAAAGLFTALCLADGSIVPATDIIALAGISLADVIPRAHLAADAPSVAGPAALHGGGTDATKLDIPSPGPPETPRSHLDRTKIPPSRRKQNRRQSL